MAREERGRGGYYNTYIAVDHDLYWLFTVIKLTYNQLKGMITNPLAVIS